MEIEGTKPKPAIEGTKSLSEPGLSDKLAYLRQKFAGEGRGSLAGLNNDDLLRLYEIFRESKGKARVRDVGQRLNKITGQDIGVDDLRVLLCRLGNIRQLNPPKVLAEIPKAGETRSGLFIRAEGVEADEKVKAANLVMKALAEVFTKTAETARGKADKSKEYGTVADVLGVMLSVLEAVGSGELIFKRNLKAESEIRSATDPGDEEVRFFEAGPLKIGQKRISRVEFLIRPTDKENAQARTKMTVKSPDLPMGAASVRIDPPDGRHGNKVVFDLVVGKTKRFKGVERSLIDKLSLGQKAGHHFAAEGIGVEDFGSVTIADIHRTIARRLESLAGRQ